MAAAGLGNRRSDHIFLLLAEQPALAGRHHARAPQADGDVDRQCTLDQVAVRRHRLVAIGIDHEDSGEAIGLVKAARERIRPVRQQERVAVLKVAHGGLQLRLRGHIHDPCA